MKILVVSGFLGAGKTTFIEKIVENVDKDIVILENEYGEVGVDGDLLKKEDINIWEMTEGCICCSMESNFAISVLTISNTMNPEFLIVEPTGVGMLSSVMKNISKVKYDRIEILDPITIVDPNCIDRYMNEFGEIFNDQIKNSKRIIISKISENTQDVINNAENKIKTINPDAKIYKSEYSDLDNDVWEDIVENRWDREIDNTTGKPVDIGIENIGFSGVSFDSLEKFETYMGAIMRGRFGDVIRAKGFLQINDVWSKFDIVNDRYTLTQIEPMEESKLILIGKKLNKEELEILFK